MVSTLCLITISLGACGTQAEVTHQTIQFVMEPCGIERLTLRMEVGDILQGYVRVQSWLCIGVAQEESSQTSERYQISSNETSTNIIVVSLIDPSNRILLSKKVLSGSYDFCHEASVSGIYTVLFDNTLCHLYRQYISFHHEVKRASLD